MSSTFRFVWNGNVLLHETFKKTTQSIQSLLRGYSRALYQQLNSQDDIIPSKSVSIDIPNAISAIDYQKSLIEKDLGAYEVKTNSCVDHISEVLREGGVNIPKSPLGKSNI